MSFSWDAAKLDSLPPAGVALSVVHAEMARSIIDRRTANQPSFDRLALSYRLAAFALLAQAGLWILSLSPIV